MKNIIEKTRYKIFYIPTKKVNYCIFPSRYCDYTQFNSTKLHPHAEKDRGVFKEDTAGYIKLNNNDWDNKPGVLFSELLEFRAIQDHYNGKENWKNSEFASRNVNYIKDNNIVRGFKNYKSFLIDREKQIDELIISIEKKGVYPLGIMKNKELFVDNISIALTRNNDFFFNNRGHHRLSIAKILGIPKIPIKITVAKTERNLNEIYSRLIN